MARLFRASYTRPIPTAAEFVTAKGKPHARYVDGHGHKQTVPLTKDGKRLRFIATNFTGQYRNADGKLISVALYSDQTSSEQELARLVRLEDRRDSGLIDRFSEHASRPLAEHVAEWGESILNAQSGKSHADKVTSCVRRIIDGCKFVIIADISASRVLQFLADLRKNRQPANAIDPAKEVYTRTELAALLRVKPCAVASLVRRHRLTGCTSSHARQAFG